MSKAQSLTAEALEGFAAASSGIEAAACPYYESSSSGMAWRLVCGFAVLASRHRAAWRLRADALFMPMASCSI